MKRPGKTPSFRAPNSIAEIAYLRLGGVEQWVMMRGENVANPPLILLHGGPGMSETGFFRRFNAPLEKSFTLVYWDQRGAGKSFDPSAPPNAEVPDPYSGGATGFEEVLDICERACAGLVEHIRGVSRAST